MCFERQADAFKGATHVELMADRAYWYAEQILSSEPLDIEVVVYILKASSERWTF